jgi:hypothetical protein
LTLGGHARFHFGNKLLPDFYGPLLERSAAGFLRRVGNEVLPDFFKASAASFCRSAFILTTKCCRIFRN